MPTKDLNDAILDLFCLIINNNDFWKDVVLRLEVKDFPEKIQQNIFNTIANLNEQKYKINESNILNALANYVIIDEQDQNYLLHKNYLLQILDRTDYLVDLKDCIEIIKNASIKNKLDVFANEILATQISLINAKDQFKEMHEKFLEILASRTEDTIENMELIANRYFEKLNKIGNSGIIPGVIKTKYDNIDKFTNGYKPGELVVIAARPGIGKTTFCLNVMVNNVNEIIEYNENIQPNQKEKIIVMFSLEITKEQILQKFISIKTGISNREVIENKYRITKGYDTRSFAMQAINDIKSWPIFIDDRPNISIVDIEAKLYDLKKRYDIALVVLDYLQLVSGGNANKNMTRTQEVDRVSSALKIIAKEINAPVIAIAQLSRKAEERDVSNNVNMKNNPLVKTIDNSPKLSDLRESGSIEQDADVVAFLHWDRKQRNFMQNDNQETRMRDDLIEAKFIVEKNRNGSTGETDIIFSKLNSKFIRATTSKE